MRLIVFLSILICASLSAREWPLWDNHETVASYAERVKLAPTKTLELGNGVKLELVLIPAGRFVMGTVEPVKLNATLEEAEWMVVLGAVLTIVLFVMLHFRYRKAQKRHFSLGWLLMLTATVGLFVGGIARRNALEPQWKKYTEDLRIFTAVPKNEKPAHDVTISRPFYMGKYTVTEEQYVAVMKKIPAASNYSSRGPMYPVDHLSWNDAMSFCGKVNVHLPTEAQWEYACRAGTITRYYAGDSESDLDRVGWYYTNSRRMTHPVGGKGSNAFGLYDMHGNVWQWCADGLRVFSATKQIDPTGPMDGNAERVLHGGSWGNPPDECRSSFRTEGSPAEFEDFLGFRVVIPVPE